MKIINPEQSYTFSKYFDLGIVAQGLQSYRVPEDIEFLMRILVPALIV